MSHGAGYLIETHLGWPINQDNVPYAHASGAPGPVDAPLGRAQPAPLAKAVSAAQLAAHAERDADTRPAPCETMRICTDIRTIAVNMQPPVTAGTSPGGAHGTEF